ncbi:ABC transporter permease [Cyclobacteriaceae bacterium YHN15]|jgi:putative ABC transport system permease protein|nr:ABC transporter permease [Cyclobacteriaceae bacterium YHN15]
MWKNYFKIGFRNLLKNKTYTIINLLGLTVGIATSILLFFYIQHQLSFDTFHTNKEAIFRILRTQQSGEGFTKGPSMPLALKPVLEENFSSEMIFTNLLNNSYLTKEDGGEGFSQSVLFVSPAFYEMFSFRMLSGTFPKSSENRHDIVLSQSTSQRYFGNQEAIGKTLLVRLADQFISFNVVGVIEDTPSNSSFSYELIMLDDNTDQLYTEEQRNHWHMAFGDAYLMVKNKDNALNFEKSMQSYIDRIFNDREDPIDYNFELQPLSEVYMNTEVAPGFSTSMNPTILWILAGIGVLIIVIACINFTTMAIGSSAYRAREVGVRKSMGAASGQLFGQFMSESILITLASLFLGLILASLFLPVFNELMDTALKISFTLNQVLILFGIGLIIAVMAGSYPAIFLSSFKPVEVLKSNMSLKFGKQNLRLGLLGFQFFISIFLITCTVVMYRQMKTIEGHDLGINHTSILQVEIPPPASQGLMDFIEKGFDYARVFKTEIQKMPEVENVSIATSIYGDNSWFQAGFDTPDDQSVNFSINIIDENFVDVFGLQILEGRNFSENIPSDRSGAFLVNESMKAELGWETVLGSSLESRRGFPENKAIGTVKNFHFESLYNDITPAILVLNPDHVFGGLHSLWMSEDMTPKLFVKLQTKNAQASIEKMSGIWKDLYGSDPFNYSFLDERIAKQYTKDQSLRSLVSVAAILAIIIAGMGLFAMASLAIASRIKEIGIRKVLGATTLEISLLFNKDFLKITLIGILTALPASYYFMQQWLEDFAVKTTMGLGIFILVIVIGIAFSILVVSSQTIKASWLNPVKTLKTE